MSKASKGNNKNKVDFWTSVLLLGPGKIRKHCCGNIAAVANVSQFCGARNNVAEAYFAS